MPQPIDVYYWPTPNGHKITIALEEMELPYEIIPVNIGRGDQFKDDFLKIGPNGRMPVIVDHDGPGGEPISVFESGAILQYLGRKTGKLYPADERANVEVDQWVHWQMAGLGPMAGQRNHFRNYAPSMHLDQRHSAYGAIRYTNEVHRLYGVMDTRLKDRDYLAGDYSIADIISWPWVSGSSSSALMMEDFPNLTAWKHRIGEREQVKKALAAASAVMRAPAITGSGAEANSARNMLFGQRART